MNEPLPIVVLISGNGSNLQTMIDAIAQGLPIRICSVISNRPDVLGLQRAQTAGIPTHVVDHKNYTSRDDFDQDLADQIDHYSPKYIILAGFMRRLGDAFIARYQGHLLNIHPSLLPKYPGLHTHRRMLDAGDSQHGTSIHFVTDEVDSGPVICQARLDVNSNDTEESLKTRVQHLEHQMYPKVLEWLAHGRLKMIDHHVYLDDEILPKSGILLTIK